MTELSPAAQAVLDAAMDTPEEMPYEHDIAAALRAAVDQVVPLRPEPTEESVGVTVNLGYAWALFSQANDVREKFLAIVAELEDFQ